MMNRKLLAVVLVLLAVACQPQTQDEDKRPAKVYLIGDSTVADYTQDDDYQSKRYPITGWGQVFQPLMTKDSLAKVAIISADSVLVDDRAKGGRSTRTFFQEGRWRAVYDEMQPGDFVLMQFGHNDAAESKPERYVNIEGYKEFLRLFIAQTREKGGTPVLITPVSRNYPWSDEGVLQPTIHGEYPGAMKEVAEELNVYLIDLTTTSAELFSQVGRQKVAEKYFMNLPAGLYEAYPDGQHDNTHFQPEGARAVAALVFKGLTELTLKK
ncbi:rhamnogalacturonan acetylesterase [Mangrovibacterium marinum]|uniref:Lysophospholipase L1-like esterase n=1 Tax=Mangrovibacterium marinum TaxID=1639118 RepID=A0A2T5C4K0_9BACT|nr:rhamnogalacturonan acetylesterase [Mangrovibacterium marinum]PTN09800.1 lysophospholipase L1-like esterase [Mangrovibacterium marinum]